MNEEYESAHDKADSGSKKEEIESLLGAISDALEDDLDCSAGYVNEFGDFTIAIPLGGDQKTLDRFIEKQELLHYLAELAERFTSHAREEGSEEITCCFIGFNQEEAPWIMCDDEHTNRVADTLKSLVDNLSIRGTSRYLVGGSNSCAPVVAEAICKSNAYLEASKEWQGVPENWKPSEVSEIPIYPEDDGRSIDDADIVVALARGDGDPTEDFNESYSLKILTYAASQGKPAIVFWTEWFENDWPAVNKVGTLLPKSMTEQLAENPVGSVCDAEWNSQ